MWYLLKDKLDGDDALGKLKGLDDGEGIMGYQKLYKFYSAVTGSTLSHKMGLAMNPERPKKISDVAGRLEKWNQLVNALEKYGPAYSLGLPYRVTALKSIMCHATEWFDAWQAECYRTPDLLSEATYQKLFAKCEDWARKKRLEVDTKDNDAMDVGGVDQGANEGGLGRQRGGRVLRRRRELVGIHHGGRRCS